MWYLEVGNNLTSTSSGPQDFDPSPSQLKNQEEPVYAFSDRKKALPGHLPSLSQVPISQSMHWIPLVTIIVLSVEGEAQVVYIAFHYITKWPPPQKGSLPGKGQT